jgi:signal transduction histidine kinase
MTAPVTVPRSRRTTLLRRTLLSKVVLYAILAVCLACLIIVGQRAAMSQQLQLRARAMARFVANQAGLAILVGDRRELRRLTANAMQNDGVLGVSIEDMQGHILARSQREQTKVKTYGRLAAREPIEITEENRFNDWETHHRARAKVAGYVSLELSESGQQSLFLSTVGTVVGLLVLTLVANLAIEYFRMRKMLLPLKRLMAFTERVGLGDLSERTMVESNDEIGDLAAAFDRMVIDLNHSRQELFFLVDEAEQANKMKNTFLANMSHELRTPLNGILGMTYLALETQVTEEQHDYLSTVQGLGASLLKIINDILDLCKIEAGKMSLDPVAFELRKELGNVVKSLSYAAREKGLNLTLDVAERIPDGLVGDSLRLNQILLNVMSNAVKFTSQGEVSLSVSARPATDGRCTLLFTVADTGIGIPAEALKKIFDPFTQADNSTTRNYGGTGLGLTICSKLVRMLGGEIWIESEPKAGTKVFFTAVFDFSQPPALPAPAHGYAQPQCV